MRRIPTCPLRDCERLFVLFGTKLEDLITLDNKSTNTKEKTLMKKYLFSVVVLFALVGCASGPPMRAYSGITTDVTIPAINVETSAEIGQTIISTALLTRLAAIELPKDASENVNSLGTTTVHAGKLPLFASNENGKIYKDYSATYSVFSAKVPTTGGIFVPHDTTKPPVVYHFGTHYLYGKIPVSGIKETTIEQWGKGSFKREIVYSGVSQNTISLLYREYSDNFARPAFSQELKYDLAQGKTIGYKGARFEVIKATNTELIYKVIKPLD